MKTVNYMLCDHKKTKNKAVYRAESSRFGHRQWIEFVKCCKCCGKEVPDEG